MNPKEITRRDTLKLSGLALGGLAVGGAARAGADCTPGEPCYPQKSERQGTGEKN